MSVTISLKSQNSNKELEILNSLIQTVHKSTKLKDIYNIALDSVIELENVEIVGIYLVNKNGNEAILQAHRNLSSQYLKKASTIAYPKGITWKVINTGKINNIPDAQKDPDLGPAGRELGFHSIFSVPIFLEKKVIGVIHFHSTKVRKFNEREVKLLTSMGNQIAIAISRIKAYEQLQKQNKYKSIINKISENIHSSIELQQVLDNAVISLCENIDKVNNVLIYLVEDNEAILKAFNGELDENYLQNAARIPYPKAATWKTIIEKKPRYVPDVDKDNFIGTAGRMLGIQSYMSTPIEYKVQGIGCIHIHSYQKYAFGDEELELLNTVSQQIQTAIVNARNAEVIKQSEERYRTLFYQAPAGVYTFDTNLVITDCNERMAKIIGTTREKIIGLDLKKLDDKTFVEGMTKALGGEIYIEEESQYKTTTTSKNVWLSIQVSPLYNSYKEVIGGMAVVEDITEKKKTEQKLMQSQRLESIGTLAGGIAHNLNNMLQPIMMSLELIKEKIEDNQIKNKINILEDSVHRGKSLVNQVLSFARGSEVMYQALKVDTLVKEIKNILNETLPKNIEIKANIQEEIWEVLGDITQLHQVIMNMCINASDAMPDGGTLSISVKYLKIDKNYAKININAKPGPYVIITISDTGAGIPGKFIDQIFDPFFTTKEPGKGTGLGLSTSYTIVKNHGGFIDVKSKVGEGTEFKIFLPAIKQKITTETEKKDVNVTPKGNNELILLVDDEKIVREVTKQILEKNGYRVITANDGVEAISVYKKNKSDIKLVIMDVMMPEMDGKMSTKALQEINPEVKVILSTGLKSDDAKTSDANRIKVAATLKKPYTSEIMLTTVNKVIEYN